MELKKVESENGVLRWKCEADEDMNRFDSSRSVPFILPLGFLLFRDEKFPIMLLSCGITVLIVIVCSLCLLNRKKHEAVSYTLTEDDIRLQEGTEMIFVSFRRVRYMEVRENNRIILHTRFSQIPVYIPQEDFDVIRGLIEKRIEEKGKRI